MRLVSGAASCTSADSTPAGAVMGFNLASCPSGWTDFAAGQGRFLVGVGASTGGGAFTYTLGVTGGENWHTLTEAEMPRHSHDLNTLDLGANPYSGGNSKGPYGKSWGPGMAAPNSGSAGGDQPHENRPPFVAVLWCVKS